MIENKNCKKIRFKIRLSKKKYMLSFVLIEKIRNWLKIYWGKIYGLDWALSLIKHKLATQSYFLKIYESTSKVSVSMFVTKRTSSLDDTEKCNSKIK